MNDTNPYAFLQTLQVDDRVIVDSNHGRQTLRKVGKVTGSYVILDNGERFRKADGYLPGRSTWDTDHLVEVTPERLEQLRRAKEKRVLLDGIQATKFGNLPLETLRRIAAIINETPDAA